MELTGSHFPFKITVTESALDVSVTQWSHFHPSLFFFVCHWTVLTTLPLAVCKLRRFIHIPSLSIWDPLLWLVGFSSNCIGNVLAVIPSRTIQLEDLS